MATYTYSDNPGRFKAESLMDALAAASIGELPYLESGVDGAWVKITTTVLAEQQVTDIVNAHDPNALSGGEILAAEMETDRVAIQQAQADLAVADIDAELVIANADLAGWDVMTTTDKIAACKRMLETQVEVLRRQRKIIKYVRWL